MLLARGGEHSVEKAFVVLAQGQQAVVVATAAAVVVVVAVVAAMPTVAGSQEAVLADVRPTELLQPSRQRASVAMPTLAMAFRCHLALMYGTWDAAMSAWWSNSSQQ